MDVAVVFPVVASQLDRRASALCQVYMDLIRATGTGGPIEGAVFLAWVNGPETLELASFDLMRKLPSGIRGIRLSAVPDKTQAVNEAITVARALNWRKLIICDNDLRVPLETIAAMIRAFNRYNGRRVAVCEKLGLVTPTSTNFQRDFSAFANYVIRKRLIPNRRPSGSLYILDPQTFFGVPTGANEGDYLALQPIVHSNRYIYSEYPPSLEQERRRRLRLTEASDRIGFSRDIQDPNIYAYWITNGSIVDGIRAVSLLAPALVFGSVMAPDLVPDAHSHLVGGRIGSPSVS